MSRWTKKADAQLELDLVVLLLFGKSTLQIRTTQKRHRRKLTGTDSAGVQNKSSFPEILTHVMRIHPIEESRCK
jgi:hypothetical protein